MKVVEHSPLHAVVEVKGVKLDFDFRLDETKLQPLFSGSEWGTCIWGVSVSLSNYIEKNVSLEGNCVIEMGAGYGLCGFAAALCGSNKVIMTDKEPEAGYLREGVKKNKEKLPEGVIEVESLAWGRLEAERVVSQHGQADVILCADCISTDVYGRQSWQDLIISLSILAKPGASIYVASTKRKDDGLKEFVDSMEPVFPKHKLLQRESGEDAVLCFRFSTERRSYSSPLINAVIAGFDLTWFSILKCDNPVVCESIKRGLRQKVKKTRELSPYGEKRWSCLERI